MRKGLTKICLVFFLAFISVNILWAKEQPELVSPGGAEMDFALNVTKCYGTDTKPVEARWQGILMKAHYLEYDRKQNTLFGQIFSLIESKPDARVFTCNEAVFNLDKDYLTAQKNVKIKYDDHTGFFGNMLEWDRKSDFIKLSGSARITFDDWQITGERIEGKFNKGTVTIFGPAQGAGNGASFKAGKIIFDRALEKVYLEDGPVLHQGKNELTAVEIIYDLKARKALFNKEVSIVDSN